MQKVKYPLALIILDGFGIYWKTEGNAIAQAVKPNLDFFMRYFPKTTVAHSELAVGLPRGIVGNSEVGHKSIGSGRISLQSMYAIKQALELGTFFDNEAFMQSINHAQVNNSKIHIIGLLSDAGGHSHTDHLFGIFRFLINHAVKNPIFIHAFTDGRDVPPRSAWKYIDFTQKTIMNSGLNGKFASLGGRYFGMDRGGNWDRIEKNYNAFIGNTENKIKEGEIKKYIDECYAKDTTDEFIEPAVIADSEGKAIGPIADGDAIIFFNFRPDRMKEILECFTNEDFVNFPRKKLQNIQITSLTEYETSTENKSIAVAFQEPRLDNTLAEVLSKNGLTQLHLTEKEKEAHITYFLNGGHEQAFPGEKHIIIPSPKVKTYDLKPEMSCIEIADTLIENLQKKNFDFYAINFANTDMVAHTGNLEASIKAVEAVDSQLGRIYEEISKQNGFMMIVSDHGNSELLINEITGEPDTEHNPYPAPFLLISPQLKREKPSLVSIEEMAKMPSGLLADVMPTILDLYNLPIPGIEMYPERKGSSLLRRLK
ncbi:MAG TPA: 2,3-bisphosphoglycerate-independent phosphoglycerate mutase [Patescibacteria group bacterium]|nr:2,3-bisphosphoglycerate-independent phosphoglycerate mutase [Patescibacteria group bacterium]